MKLTKNFTLQELENSYTADRHGVDNSIPEDYIYLAKRIAEEVLQPLRTEVGPLRINSGYRCLKLNGLVGGSSSSQHVYQPERGAACDLVHSKGKLSVLQLAQAVIQLGIKFDQMILEFTSSKSGGWLHISIPGDNKNHREMILSIDKGVPTKQYSKQQILEME